VASCGRNRPIASMSPVSATTVDSLRSCSSWFGITCSRGNPRPLSHLLPGGARARGQAFTGPWRMARSRAGRYAAGWQSHQTHMADTELRIALLIDADNAPASRIEPILTELARHGVANVRRAYGNWKNPHLKSWEHCLHGYAIQPIQQFAYTSRKNASDMAMVIDAMDLLSARNLDGFAIVSSDADFTPLVMRLRNENMRVFGFGEEKTPKAFVNACSTFLYLEKLDAGDDDDKAADSRPKSSSQLQGDARLIHLLRTAVSATS